MVRVSGLACAGLASALLAGCASTAAQRGSAEVDKLIAARGGTVPTWSASEPQSARVSEMLGEPLTLDRAVQLAFVNNAQVRATYAELGIAHSEVIEGSRPGNPRIGYVSLEEEGSGAKQISRSVSLGLADLLMLPWRARLARTELLRSRDRIGAELLELEAGVNTAWFGYVSAIQIAELRDAAAQTAEASAELAQGLKDAGNLPAKTLALEMAAASTARVAASRARVEAIEARSTLASLMGVSVRESWEVPKQLPAPPSAELPQDRLVDRALETRLDVSAARREVDVLSGALGLTRRWRWLGDVEVGYERESETDGAKLRGPSFSLELPIFNQNQSGVLRAQSELEGARAKLTALELSVRNDVSAGLDRLATAQQIAETYRTAVIPHRETVVARTQEEVNFMLAGAFELIQARREEFDAYQEYLEAVRDYWTARTELRLAVGGALPGDELKPGDAVGLTGALQ